jgi:hypothetical protein
MSPLRSRGILSTRATTLAMIALVCLVVPPIAAAEERQFYAELSLTGGCTVPEELDPVQDPECPETPPATSNHPAEPFARPTAVATDSYGNIYVSNGGKKEDGSEGRIDIFDPTGVFITELKPPTGFDGKVKAIAIDSQGTLYAVTVASSSSGTRVLGYSPTGTYAPETGEIEYASPPNVVREGSLALSVGLAIDQTNDHLFAHFGGGNVWEFKSAEEGNGFVRDIEVPTYAYGNGIAVDSDRRRLYVSEEETHIGIYDLDQLNGNDEYELIDTIEGSAVPAGSFNNYLSIAVDEGTAHLLVLDGGVNRVYEFDETGTYLATIEHGFQVEQGAEIAIDNGAFSPSGALNESGRYLFVPSHKTGTGHSFAFEVSKVGPPEVESVSAGAISDHEAELQALIDPGSLSTTYIFEFMTQQQFEEAGDTFSGATVAGSGELPPENSGTEAAATVNGLQAGTQYRFRVEATNSEGIDEAVGAFATYPNVSVEPVSCPNRDLRSGLSSGLPDCRAYELVTPADSNARAPSGSLAVFPTRQVSPAGDKTPWIVEGGSLPGEDGTGSMGGDPYLSTRGVDGWSTAYIGPSGTFSTAVFPGGYSPDIGYSFWTTGPIGPASIDGEPTSYVRYPDGHSELLGKGSLATDPNSTGRLISEGGEHMIFNTGGVGNKPAIQLEPQAAPPVPKIGTAAIYDRAPSGELRVVSLRPGGLPFDAGETAIYQGASLDGKGVAFTVENTLYLRYENSETYDIGTGVDFAGVAEGGSRIFYTESGILWRFDAMSGERVPFSSGAVTPVNISADGNTAYFVSKSVLTKALNPNGAKAKVGKYNLYLSKEGAVEFVGTLTERDVVGDGKTISGLGLWMDVVGAPNLGEFGLVPARSTPDGSALLFESGAALAGYDPEEHQQIYRYDSVAKELDCLSCNPTGAAPTGRARLSSLDREGTQLFSPRVVLANLRADGRRAFFESTEALVPSDTDGLQDVYEWEDQGIGSCTSPDGCVYLISSGQSVRNDYLWAISESGDDVFFLSADMVLPADADATPSIYDARVGGGFPEPVAAECQGEGCRPQLQAPPVLPSTHTPVQGTGDNVKPRRCPKGKRKVKRAGKVRCVKKKNGRRAGTNRGGVGR